MALCRRGVALAVLLLCMGAAARVRADEAPRPPGPGLLITGIVVAAGGGVLAYAGARSYQRSDGSSLGPLFMSSLGTLGMQIGGALETTWAWQLGESRAWYDVAGNVPLRSRRPMGLTGLAVGGAAFAGMLVAQGIVIAKEISCTHANVTTTEILTCAKDTVMTATIVDLAAGGVLLVVAPVVGYAFGYDTAVRDAGGTFTSLRLAPILRPDGGGLALGGRF
jgi:hypothetical protein